MSESLRRTAREVTQSRLGRFASVLADEREVERCRRLLQEECDALRVGIHSSCLVDRSAAQEVADEFDVELSTIYRQIDGEIKTNPLRLFCRLQDAIIRAKGSDSAAALEPARLIRRRYLDPHPEAPASAELATASVVDMLKASTSLAEHVLSSVSAESANGRAVTTEEWERIAPLVERLQEAAESVRLLNPACLRSARRVEIDGRRPS